MTIRSAPTPNEFKILRYMSRFSCIGPKCEDTCCGGWGITVSKSIYQRIKKGMDNSKAERNLFREALARNRPTDGNPVDDGEYARIQMRKDNDHCHFLTEEGWCGVQNRIGDKAVPDICMVYPRMQGQFGTRLETAGYISCPEAARLMLLADDSCVVDDCEAPLSDRRVMVQYSSPKASKPYLRHLDTIREVFLRLMELPGASLRARQFLMCLFADRVTPFFHEDVDADADPADQLAAEISRLGNAQERNSAIQFIESQEPKQAFSVMVVAQVLGAVTTTGKAGRYADLVQTIFDGYLERTGQPRPDADAEGAKAWQPDISAVVSEYTRTIRSIELAASDSLNRMFGNFTKYFVYSHWYTKSPNLVEYTQRLLLERALVRFMLAGHPEVYACLTATAEEHGAEPTAWPDEARARFVEVLEAAAVQSFYLTARSYEHGVTVMKEIGEALKQNGLQSLAGSVYLLTF